MSKVSPLYGELIRKILDKHSLTFRAAGLKTCISAAYWKDMTDGRVPSEEIIDKIGAAFPDADLNELRAAAGYSAKMSDMDAVQAVEFALRGQNKLPEEGKKQILDFVKRVQENYGEGKH